MYGESSTRLSSPWKVQRLRENSLTPRQPERQQHHGRLLPIAIIQRSLHRILEVWPEDDHEGKLDNMYLDGRNDIIRLLCAVWKINYTNRLGGRASPAGPN